MKAIIVLAATIVLTACQTQQQSQQTGTFIKMPNGSVISEQELLKRTQSPWAGCLKDGSIKVSKEYDCRVSGGVVLQDARAECAVANREENLVMSIRDCVAAGTVMKVLEE